MKMINATEAYIESTRNKKYTQGISGLVYTLNISILTAIQNGDFETSLFITKPIEDIDRIEEYYKDLKFKVKRVVRSSTLYYPNLEVELIINWKDDVNHE